MQTFASWVALPESEAARLAVGRVAECVCSRGPRRTLNPLFLHGPAGTGKTHLLAALVAEVTGRCPDLVVSVLPAGDFDPLPGPDAEDPGPDVHRQADLLVVEDLQHLPARAAPALASLADHRRARERQTVWSATRGPAQLAQLPARLTSRLAGGLVVGLQLLSPASRLTFLWERVAGRPLALDPPVLEWLARHIDGSARQLEGAVSRLEALARLQRGPLGLETVAEHFRTEADTRRLTVERIAQRVGLYFRVEPRHLQSRRRSRDALLPRQVGMYLARQLTDLSLQQIGAYFGGRDHSTVLHACRKVEQALARDVALSGAVRQLHADLA